MANSHNYDYSIPYSPLTSLMYGDVFDLSNTIGLNNIASTPAGSNPSNNSSLSSPLQLIVDDDNVFMSEFSNCGCDCGLLAPNTDPFPNSWDTCSIEVLSQDCQNEKLQVVAEPKASYRGRYVSEIDKDKNRAKRFIRAENNDEKHEYPTIKIPSWCHPNQQLYIRVTLVTIANDRIPYRCIHPYTIDTLDKNATRDKDNHSLLFRISEKEFTTREKSFRIIVTKKKQDELKSYGPMILFDPESYENIDIENPQDPKEKISLYQLRESQFIFTIAEEQDNNSLPVLLCHTSVESQIMVDDTVDTRNSITDHPNGTSISRIICIPQQGNWIGGDEIVIIMPNPIKRKEYTIYFDFGQYGQRYINEIIRIDTKTLLFRIPSCPLLPGDDNLKVSIIIQNNKSIISPIDFCYITPIRTTINLCSSCQGNVMNNKRKCEYDTGDNLVSQMSRLSIKQTTNQSRSHASSLISVNEKLIKFDKYLSRLKDALEIFIRTNNPSQLFRQTSILLSTYDGNSSPLHDAIQNGHTQLALTFIEQIINMPSLNKLLENENENGETLLLIAGKFNQWKLIESILKNRSDLVKQKDKDGNNLFHLLANLSEDKGFETIENVLAILPNELKINLIKEQNKSNQKPMDIAQSHGNTASLKLLIDIGNNL